MYAGRILEKKPLAMRDFDRFAVVKVARAHLATLREPRRRQILENFIEHAEAEAAGDHERLMASCSKERQQYAVHGSSFPAPQSYAELEAHYHGLIASNLHWIHFEVEKLVVGDDVVFVEGIVHQLYPGRLVEPLYGVRVEDPDAVYQATKRTALSFVFDAAGKGAGEHAWSDGPLTADDLTRVPPEEVPAAFHENPLSPAAAGTAAAGGPVPIPDRKRLRDWAHRYVALWNAGDREGWIANWRRVAPGDFRMLDPVGTPEKRGFERCALDSWDLFQSRVRFRIAPGSLFVCGNEVAWLLENHVSHDGRTTVGRSIETYRFEEDGSVVIRTYYHVPDRGDGELGALFETYLPERGSDA